MTGQVLEEKKAKILIVEDDVEVADMLDAYFHVQGYDASTVNWGEDGVKTCQAEHPDLVILDIKLPDIDGFEVAQLIRDHRGTKDTPIIFLTERRGRESRLKSLQLHADDYITKPFDIQDLRLRVRNALQRGQRVSLTNPVTGLPLEGVVDENLSGCLEEGGWMLLIISLQNLGRFRDIYGFVASDDLLRAVTLMIQDSIHRGDSPKDFLGHLTSTDFVLITKPEHTAYYQDRISSRLGQSFDYFYRDQDRESDIFNGAHLAVQITELQLSLDAYKNPRQLKAELAIICGQEIH